MSDVEIAVAEYINWFNHRRLHGEIGLSNTQLGSLTSAYFLAFACMQLPLGIWLDRRPRWSELNALLEDAYRAVAPKRLGARLDDPSARQP